jgi:hypothetical protein
MLVTLTKLTRVGATGAAVLVRRFCVCLVTMSHTPSARPCLQGLGVLELPNPYGAAHLRGELFCDVLPLRCACGRAFPSLMQRIPAASVRCVFRAENATEIKTLIESHVNSILKNEGK